MNLIALPAFTDNYIWMLHDGQRAVDVDPGESAPVSTALNARQLVLAAILVTDHHAGHVGGVDALRERLQRPVYGPKRERTAEPYVALLDGDHVEVPSSRFEVFDVPGHTGDHIAYFHAADSEALTLFCGDTLVSGGCGRLFEPSRLAALPGNTRAYCSDEHALSNLTFAPSVEPNNPELADCIAWCDARRNSGHATLRSSIARERLVNPFLRCRQSAVAISACEHGANSDDPVAVVAPLRQWKNKFQ